LEIRNDDSFFGVVLGDLWGRGGVEEAWPQENVKEGDMVVERDGGEDMMYDTICVGITGLEVVCVFGRDEGV